MAYCFLVHLKKLTYPTHFILRAYFTTLFIQCFIMLEILVKFLFVNVYTLDKVSDNCWRNNLNVMFHLAESMVNDVVKRNCAQAFCFNYNDMIWALTRGNLSSGFVNNKGEDQPGQMHSMISTFILHFLESIISKLTLQAKFQFIASLCSRGDWFKSCLLETPKTGLSRRGPYHILELTYSVNNCQFLWTVSLHEHEGHF